MSGSLPTPMKQLTREVPSGGSHWAKRVAKAARSSADRCSRALRIVARKAVLRALACALAVDIVESGESFG